MCHWPIPSLLLHRGTPPYSNDPPPPLPPYLDFSHMGVEVDHCLCGDTPVGAALLFLASAFSF